MSHSTYPCMQFSESHSFGMKSPSGCCNVLLQLINLCPITTKLITGSITLSNVMIVNTETVVVSSSLNGHGGFAVQYFANEITNWKLNSSLVLDQIKGKVCRESEE